MIDSPWMPAAYLAFGAAPGLVALGIQDPGWRKIGVAGILWGALTYLPVTLYCHDVFFITQGNVLLWLEAAMLLLGPVVVMGFSTRQTTNVDRGTGVAITVVLVTVGMGLLTLWWSMSCRFTLW